MRRLDLRPLKKLRNPGRHLRRLAGWPGRIVTQIPDAAMLEGDRFWNFKVPVFSKVIEPPHATRETRTACLAAIFATAEAIEHSPRRPANCRIACLVTTPHLFESEVTIFTDEDYFRSFLPTPTAGRTAFDGGWIEAEPIPASGPGWPAGQEPFAGEYAPIAQPEGLAFMGGTKLVEFDAELDRTFTRTNWVWAYPRR